MNTISILIQTFNEEKNIRTALESVAWSDEVILVDNYSTDATVDIARTFPNVTILQRKFDGYAAQKNWALDTVQWKHDWIFILDADESISPDLQTELLSITSEKKAIFVGYYVNRKIIFLGKWLRHGGWYPSWNIRLLRRGKGRYEDRAVHEHMIIEGDVGYLSHDLIHEDKKKFSVWLARHNSFSTLEASEIFALLSTQKKTGFALHTISSTIEKKRFLKERVLYRLPLRPLLWFCYLYFFKCGFLDGWHGVTYSFLYAMQQLHTDIKLKELRHDPGFIKNQVKAYWNTAPCGTPYCPYPEASSEFFSYTKKRRKKLEPFIEKFAKFHQWQGKQVLEVGCGTGVDTAEFARHGGFVHAIDLSSHSVSLTQKRLAHEKLTATILQADAEHLPFPDNTFDYAYSWGVLHHTPDTPAALSEVQRVLKKDGRFCIMLYNKSSLLALQLFLLYGLFHFRLFIGRDRLFSEFLESPGTKAYTKKEVEKLFQKFQQVRITPVITPYDLRIGKTRFLPRFIHPMIPASLGFFLIIEGTK